MEISWGWIPLNPEGLDPVGKIQETKSIFAPPLLVEVYIT
jgi:hypothetical protein